MLCATLKSEIFSGNKRSTSKQQITPLSSVSGELEKKIYIIFALHFFLQGKY